MNFLIGLFVSFPCFLLRAFLHGGGGPEIGEATCGGSPHLSCKRDQIKKRDFMDRRVTPPRRVDIVTGSFLDFFGSNVFWYVFPRIMLWYIFLVRCSKGGWLAHPPPPGSAPDFAKFLVIFRSSAPLQVCFFAHQDSLNSFS